MDITNRTTLNNNDTEERITPLPASTKFAPVASAKKRKLSYMESQKARGRPSVLRRKNGDISPSMIPKGSNFSKTCGLCKG